jgi:hypothetical protein
MPLMNYSTQKIVVPVMMAGLGNIVFCEAIKVDLAESEDNCRNNQPQKKKNQLSTTLSSTVCLLFTLFEDLGCAIELHEKLGNEVTELYSFDPRNLLFIGQEEGDYLFGQEIINKVSSYDKECLQLYESWCLFAYREFYRNTLAILDEVSVRTFGQKTNIPNRFCKLFDFDDDERINACLMKLSNNTNSGSELYYQAVMNSQSYTIRAGTTRPCQLSLGNIPTMRGSTDSVGEGWDERKISNFFNKK